MNSYSKIVVAGIGSSGGFFRMAAVRLNTDGSLDTASFGSGGNSQIKVDPTLCLIPALNLKRSK